MIPYKFNNMENGNQVTTKLYFSLLRQKITRCAAEQVSSGSSEPLEPLEPHNLGSRHMFDAQNNILCFLFAPPADPLRLLFPFWIYCPVNPGRR